MKDAAIWNAVKNPLEIKSLAMGVNMSSVAYRPDSADTTPTAYWKMNELSGNRSDSSGSHTLTDNNTVLSSDGYIEGVAADFEQSSNEYFTAPIVTGKQNDYH